MTRSTKKNKDEDIKVVAVERVVQLPLLAPCLAGLLESYTNAKSGHPRLAGLCSATEESVRMAGNLAFWASKPILTVLQPHIAFADSLACIGLDILEEQLPFLHQPPQKVAAMATDSAMAIFRVTQGVVSSSIVLAQGLANSVTNSALTATERCIDLCLPPGADENALANAALVAIADDSKGTVSAGWRVRKQTYSRGHRVGAILSTTSTRVTRYTVEQLTATRDALTRILDALGVLDAAQSGLVSAEKVMMATKALAERATKRLTGRSEGPTEKAEDLQAGLMALMQGIVEQAHVAMVSILQVTFTIPYSMLALSARAHSLVMGLLAKAACQVSQLGPNVWSKPSGRPSRPTSLALSARGAVDGVLEHIVNNTPMSWLVPPESLNSPEAENSGEWVSAEKNDANAASEEGELTSLVSRDADAEHGASPHVPAPGSKEKERAASRGEVPRRQVKISSDS
uniref:perilipin-3-like isoform X1 n=1 Tax=Myxine glutinosa TaxID=7769 RepID=UPI00358FDCF6